MENYKNIKSSRIIKYNIDLAEKNSNTIDITKYKGKLLDSKKKLTVKILDETTIQQSLDLQDKILNNISRNDYLLRRTKGQLLHAQDGKYGITIGIIDDDKLIGQASVLLDDVNIHPSNNYISKHLGAKGLDVCSVMVDKDYAGNKLCEIIIHQITTLSERLNADYLVYRTEITNGASFVPALKQPNAIVAQCGIANIGKYLKEHGSKHNNYKNTDEIKYWSVLIPLRGQKMQTCLKRNINTKHIDPRKIKTSDYESIEKNINDKDICYIYNSKTKQMEIKESLQKNRIRRMAY